MSGEELANCHDIGCLESCRVGECFQGFFRVVESMSESSIRKQVNDLLGACFVTRRKWVLLVCDVLYQKKNLFPILTFDIRDSGECFKLLNSA